VAAAYPSHPLGPPLGAGNQQHYGQPFPPTYDLTNIPNDFPIFIGYGGADMLSSEQDVKMLLNVELKNHDPNKLVQVFVQNYAHADFIVGINAKQDVYDPMIDFFNAQ
jgi:lysosomal acid lipase/cholesteryl ester hydrolase